MIADWMMPTAPEARALRASTGCGLMIAKDKLIWRNIQTAMPDIVEKQDFKRLTDVVQWLLLRNCP